MDKKENFNKALDEAIKENVDADVDVNANIDIDAEDNIASEKDDNNNNVEEPVSQTPSDNTEDGFGDPILDELWGDYSNVPNFDNDNVSEPKAETIMPPANQVVQKPIDQPEDPALVQLQNMINNAVASAVNTQLAPIQKHFSRISIETEIKDAQSKYPQELLDRYAPQVMAAKNANPNMPVSELVKSVVPVEEWIRQGKLQALNDIKNKRKASGVFRSKDNVSPNVSSSKKGNFKSALDAALSKFDI